MSHTSEKSPPLIIELTPEQAAQAYDLDMEAAVAARKRLLGGAALASDREVLGLVIKKDENGYDEPVRLVDLSDASNYGVTVNQPELTLTDAYDTLADQRLQEEAESSASEHTTSRLGDQGPEALGATEIKDRFIEADGNPDVLLETPDSRVHLLRGGFKEDLLSSGEAEDSELVQGAEFARKTLEEELSRLAVVEERSTELLEVLDKSISEQESVINEQRDTLGQDKKRAQELAGLIPRMTELASEAIRIIRTPSINGVRLNDIKQTLVSLKDQYGTLFSTISNNDKRRSDVIGTEVKSAITTHTDEFESDVARLYSRVNNESPSAFIDEAKEDTIIGLARAMDAKSISELRTEADEKIEKIKQTLRQKSTTLDDIRGVITNVEEAAILPTTTETGSVRIISAQEITDSINLLTQAIEYSVDNQDGSPDARQGIVNAATTIDNEFSLSIARFTEIEADAGTAYAKLANLSTSLGEFKTAR